MPRQPIPFSLSSFPGANPQEGSGRLINCYAEPLGEPSKPSGPAEQVWRGSPGLSLHAITDQTGYRGGLLVNNLSFEVFSNNVTTVDVAGTTNSLGAFPGTKKVSIARNQASPTPDVVAVDVDNGAYILETAAVANASITATVAGTSLVSGDTVNIQFVNDQITGFTLTVTYTLGGGSSTTIIAAGLATLINANATLAAAGIAATSALGVLTVTQQGFVGNSTFLSSAFTGTGNETVTYSPATGFMAGGTGTPGIVFAGAPLAYNGLGILPQPNSVSFQDGYFFYTIANGQVFASGINSLLVNALTYVIIQAKADVTLLRGIPFSGVMLFFTTGSCEVWQDAANAAPNFPYGRMVVLEFGLVQSAAIAGAETGFSELLWVAQDFGVYWMTPGSLAPVKVSPPDLDRLIEAQIHAGNLLEAGCYSEGGKKFWHLSSPTWTWELNLSTKKWNERQSLLPSGIYGRWRATGGHPAFTKWLMGDVQSGNILYPDLTNFTENGSVLRFRIESGPVKNFPEFLRIARADFDFDWGTATVTGNYVMTVLAAAAGNGGVVRLTVNQTSLARSGDQVNVANVGGTMEANGIFPMTVIDATHIEIPPAFVNAYTSGGTVTDLTAPPGAVNPQVAISCSKNGGMTFDNPSIRSLAPQGKVKRSQASVKNRGQSGPMGVRWRIDITDPVYRGLLGAMMSSDPRVVQP